MGRPVLLLAVGFPAKRAAKRPARRLEIRIESGIDFEATHVTYSVTARNRGDVAVRDVMITPRVVRGPFVLDDPPKAVPLLEPGEFGTAAFRIVAKTEPAEVELAARVRYFERETGRRHEVSAPPMRVDLRPPATRPVYLDPAALEERASRSFSVQEEFELPYNAERAFPVVESALAREGLENVEELTFVGRGSFVGQVSFHGLDRRKASYAVRAIASRRDGTSTLRLLVFVQAEESLFGFAWRVREAVRRALGLAPHPS